MNKKFYLPFVLVLTVFTVFVIAIYLPLIVPHTGFKLVDGLGMRFEPVTHPTTGEQMTKIFRYTGGYTYQHWYEFKGFPESGMMRHGGFTIDGSVMRQYISTEGVSGPLVLHVWVSYTLPERQMSCSFGNRGSWSLNCFDQQQQQQLLRLP